MDGDKLVEAGAPVEQATFAENLRKISQLVNREDIAEVINIQVATIDRLECTNKSLHNCNTMAQNKLASTSRLYKRTAKQIAESKKDLDVIYKKILEMKARIKAERPDLFAKRETSCDENDQTPELSNDTKHSDQKEPVDGRHSSTSSQP